MAEEPHKATSVANRSSGLLLTNSCLLAQSLTADVCMNKGLLGKPAGIAHNMCVYLVDLKHSVVHASAVFVSYSSLMKVNVHTSSDTDTITTTRAAQVIGAWACHCARART